MGAGAGGPLTVLRHGRAAARVLVGGVGYTNLRDLSVGPQLVRCLAAESWPEGVEVRDLGYGAVHVAHDLLAAQAAPERRPYDRAVLFGAVHRGRPPGTVTAFRWDGRLPAAEDVQMHVSEAVTGVVSLEGVLVVCAQLGALPRDVRLVEIEPADMGWGEGCSPTVRAVLPEAIRAIHLMARTAS